MFTSPHLNKKGGGGSWDPRIRPIAISKDAHLLHSYCAVNSHFVAHFFVFAFTLSTREAKHWISNSSISFFSFSLRVQGERDSQTPKQNLEKFSPFLIFIIRAWNYFTSVANALSFKCFQIVPGKHKKRDVTTVFTPINQWERAHLLIHFIICVSLQAWSKNTQESHVKILKKSEKMQLPVCTGLNRAEVKQYRPTATKKRMAEAGL